MTDTDPKTHASEHSDPKPAPEGEPGPAGANGEAQADGETPESDGFKSLDAEVDELRDKLLRAVAETENTRKRAAKDVREARTYAVTSFARDMLDIADNLARALEVVSEETRKAAPEGVRHLIEGVEMTERRLQSTLERHGVAKVAPAPGDAFDPNRHQAAAHIPSDQPAGAIAHLMQPGYVIGERTLRAAMVVVSAGPAKTAAGADPAPE